MPETTLTRLTERVYWMSPGTPDRPSLAAVVGSEFTLMLDAGASAAHAALFLAALEAAGVRAPRMIALTHWHWDHIFGAARLGLPQIASSATAAQIALQAGYDWDDGALDRRVANGEEIAFCADNIKIELPEPRSVQIILPEIVFETSFDVHPGGVTCQIRQVGGDHARDSCVIYLPEERVLFLGDCLYDDIYAPTRHYTRGRLFPLIERLLTFDAEFYIEGHNPEVMTRAQFEDRIAKMRTAGALIEQFGLAGASEADVLMAAEAELGAPLDEDVDYYLKALLAGRHAEPTGKRSRGESKHE